MRKRRVVRVGNIEIGGDNPVSIQTMIKKSPDKYSQIIDEIAQLKEAGSEIIRVAYREEGEAGFIEKIIKGSLLPVEMDIHFDFKLALSAIELGADAVRINPGNISKEGLEEVVLSAKRNNIPIRVGINIGSVPEAYRKKYNSVDSMLELLKEYLEYMEGLNFKDIFLSLKADTAMETYLANLKTASLFDYPLHIGVTATGAGVSAIVKSSIGIGALLMQGVGDTIRVSLTDSTFREVEIAKEILSALGLRKFGIEVISCPGCGRAQIDILDLANKAKEELIKIKTEKGLKVAVMGCEVNGPGEAKGADIGIAGGVNCAILFKKGKQIKRLDKADLITVLVQEVREMI
ncbi:MAG: flavodoxin-dependent (E)-4-hydroxy-3-methylbut-2-enyl-diphosphate synthase [Candidatus Kaelpia aquatica]|nr:flavodoxin-dependent (E)-4-hydroxy-3-methylbut-2-enyl-diphosphate synthase [Candidatus Kaelpia aquatica]